MEWGGGCPSDHVRVRREAKDRQLADGGEVKEKGEMDDDAARYSQNHVSTSAKNNKKIMSTQKHSDLLE